MRLKDVSSRFNWSLTPILLKGTGITREGLHEALGEQGNPSFATDVKVMHALGLQFNLGARPVQG